MSDIKLLKLPPGWSQWAVYDFEHWARQNILADRAKRESAEPVACVNRSMPSSIVWCSDVPPDGTGLYTHPSPAQASAASLPKDAPGAEAVCPVCNGAGGEEVPSSSTQYHWRECRACKGSKCATPTASEARDSALEEAEVACYAIVEGRMSQKDMGSEYNRGCAACAATIRALKSTAMQQSTKKGA